MRLHSDLANDSKKDIIGRTYISVRTFFSQVTLSLCLVKAFLEECVGAVTMFVINKLTTCSRAYREVSCVSFGHRIPHRL